MSTLPSVVDTVTFRVAVALATPLTTEVIVDEQFWPTDRAFIITGVAVPMVAQVSVPDESVAVPAGGDTVLYVAIKATLFPAVAAVQPAE
jgi:hypothetical protein